MIPRLRVPAHQLREGMFVSELDRPWLETPFLFQGFLIRNQREVEELSRYCEWVFIDRERSETDVEPGQVTNARTRNPVQALFGWLRRDAARQVQPLDSLSAFERQTYADQKTTIGDELPRAEECVENAQAMVLQATQQLQTTDTIKFSLVSRAVDPIIESVLRNKDAMIWLQSMRGKDKYVFSRSVACSVWAVIFGRHLGLDRETLTLLATGSLLLDLGKVDIPAELLARNGRLNDEEMDLVRRHVDYGVSMLERSCGFDPRIIEMVRTHHERFNGTGYPNGLKGTAIPPLGKIAGILDTFVAMTSQRPYADAMATYDVMRHLNELADVEFQAELVEQFVQAVGMFPTGSLVELSTGEVAIVTSQNRVRRLRPKVMIVLGRDKQLLKKFGQVDLREQTTDSTGNDSLWIARGLPPGSYGVDPAEFFL
ncbi:MAG: HD-GYP domain-containing protein [Gammaproteobacteria bacterium]|nr:HD-GYP domain-containing protein [Gammaproteobacteria bacterium]MDH3769074.1 HD-GYP domain-containing protein [Gammaproteobacteria bacterium]